MLEGPSFTVISTRYVHGEKRCEMEYQGRRGLPQPVGKQAGGNGQDVRGVGPEFRQQGLNTSKSQCSVSGSMIPSGLFGRRCREVSNCSGKTREGVGLSAAGPYR